MPLIDAKSGPARRGFDLPSQATFRARRAIILLLAIPLIAGALPARADRAADRAAITARLQAWAAAFNARDARGACDLFARDLISMVPGSPPAGRNTVCQRLAAALARPDPRLRYSPDICEIIVSGDIAVVRLFWTLTAERNGTRETSSEAGMDLFRRQPDGTWSIIRFLSFPVEPGPKISPDCAVPP